MMAMMGSITQPAQASTGSSILTTISCIACSVEATRVFESASVSSLSYRARCADAELEPHCRDFSSRLLSHGQSLRQLHGGGSPARVVSLTAVVFSSQFFRSFA